MVALFLNFILITFFSLIFLLIGDLFLFNYLKVKSLQSNGYLKISAAFFVGLGLFLSSWQVLGRFFGLRFSIYLIIAMCLLVIINFIKLVFRSLLEFKSKFRVLAVLILFMMLIGVIKSLVPMPEYILSNPEKVSPLAGFGGVGHSFRAANIAIFIFQNNILPVLNQNVGQSLLASLTMFFGLPNPHLSLILWLSMVLTMSMVFSYGLISIFIQENRQRIFSWIFLVVGGTAFSLDYLSITDTESTLLLSTNYNTLISVFSFVIFLFICFDILNNIILKNVWVFFLWFGFFSNMFGAQNILLSFLIFTYFLISNWKSNFQRRQIILQLSTFFIGVVLGITFGGMLTPKFLISKVNIPGIMTVSQPNERPIALRFPRLSEGYSNSFKKTLLVLVGGNKKNGSEVDKNAYPAIEKVIFDDSWKDKFKKNIFIFSIARLVRSIQSIFFPLSGLIVFYFLYKKNKNLHDNLLLAYLFKITSLLFVVGIIASSSFKMYGYYWELSRFLYIGSYLAMFFTAITFCFLWSQFLVRKIFFLFIFPMYLIALFSPFSQYFVVGVVGNFVLDYSWSEDGNGILNNGKTLSIYERFDLLINHDKIIGLN